MNDSSRAILLAGLSASFAVLIGAGAGPTFADEAALRMRAAVVGATAAAPLSVELLRWSTDTERAPLLSALSAPVVPAAPPAAPAGGRAGRGGRGGRGAAPPPTPAARLAAAIKAAPTVGFIWGDGPTGYSIKYAWRAALPDGRQRVVLATDRRLGAHSTSWPQLPQAAADAEFTLIELRIDGTGAGEGKTSLTTGVVVDAAAMTLALDGYGAAPVLLEVTR